MSKKFHVGDYVVWKRDASKFPYGVKPIQIQHIDENGNLFFDDDLTQHNGGWHKKDFVLWDDQLYRINVANCKGDLFFAINVARDTLNDDKKLIKILKRKIKDIEK